LIKLKCPPSIKVLEAAGAIADGRVHLESERAVVRVYAKVVSSEGDRTYRVFVKKIINGYSAYSDDNGTRFRRYVGYPIISVLMLMKALPRNRDVEEALKGIEWRKLNETYKRYSLVEEVILRRIRNEHKINEIENFKNEVMSQLRSMQIYYDPSLGKRKI